MHTLAGRNEKRAWRPANTNPFRNQPQASDTYRTKLLNLMKHWWRRVTFWIGQAAGSLTSGALCTHHMTWCRAPPLVLHRRPQLWSLQGSLGCSEAVYAMHRLLTLPKLWITGIWSCDFPRACKPWITELFAQDTLSGHHFRHTGEVGHVRFCFEPPRKKGHMPVYKMRCPNPKTIEYTRAFCKQIIKKKGGPSIWCLNRSVYIYMYL